MSFINLCKMNKENGYVLVTTLIAIIFVSLIGAALLKLAYSDFINTNFFIRNRKAYYIARSGAEAVSNWIQNPENNIENIFAGNNVINSNSKIELGEGFYTLKIEKVDNTYKILSEGTTQNVSEKVLLELKKQKSFKIDHTVFADQGLEVGNLFKGNNNYNDKVITFGTNLSAGDENIDIHKKTEGKIIIDYDQGYKYELPEFPERNFINSNFNTINNSKLDATIYNNRFDFDQLSISNNQTLTIDVYEEDFNIYLNDLSISGELKINKFGDGIVNIYIKNNFNVNGNFNINKNGSKNDLNIYHYGNDNIHPAANSVMNANLYTQSGNVDFSGNGLVYGNLFVYQAEDIKFSGNGSGVENIVYAPNSNAELTGNSDFNGAVVANTVSIKGSAMVYGNPDTIDLPISTESKFDSIWKDV